MIRSRFARFAWAVLAYDVAVILWGAYVRATGSGAGCGGHWPLCNGEVIPLAPATHTLVEYSHRVSSALVLALAVVLLFWSRRSHPRGHPVRLGAALVMLFTLTEALVGAVLVLFGLVAADASSARACVIAVHLVNTFLLLAALALTAFFAAGGRTVRVRDRGGPAWLLGLGLLGLLLVGMSGAVTALGDTLFPPGSLAAGLREDLSPTASFLIRLRVVHPVMAAAVGLYLITIADALRAARGRPEGRALVGLVLVQLFAGVANVLLLAPVWMQLLHLLLADLVWIGLVLLAARMLEHGASAAVPGAAPLLADPR